MRWSVLVLALTLRPACEERANASAAPLQAEPDVTELRAGGRVTFERLLAEGAPAELLDMVAQQRDAAASGLFWETDLDAALAQAHARGVPVLSLRMLGSLTDERSCANSRFFRTFLYTDPALAKLMTESFVLHWSSERPVPQVEIDYGDGRVLRTTTTGNSAHYILDGDGRVLDVLPGLYDARTFESQLQGALELHAALDRDPKHRDRLLRAYHRDAITALEARLAPHMTRTLRIWMESSPGTIGLQPLPALEAQSITASKSAVESPLLAMIDVERSGTVLVPIEFRLRLLADPVVFSEAAQALVRRDRPRRSGEADDAYEERIATLLSRTGENIAYDIWLNEARLHFQIHGWFVNDEMDQDFGTFNARVYEELFATPASDAWLGLIDDTVYDGLSDATIPARG